MAKVEENNRLKFIELAISMMAANTKGYDGNLVNNAEYLVEAAKKIESYIIQSNPS